jgi:hypothetical protein
MELFRNSGTPCIMSFDLCQTFTLLGIRYKLYYQDPQLFSISLFAWILPAQVCFE